jgi:transcriptional regulator with XRE-family HTH domain
MVNNKNLLLSKLTLKGDTQEKLAEYLGIAMKTLRSKLNDESQFTQKEIIKIKKRYNLTNDEVVELFIKE